MPSRLLATALAIYAAAVLAWAIVNVVVWIGGM